MARTPGTRTPIAIGLLVSLAAHLAVLAMVAIDIPETPVTSPMLTWIEVAPAEPASELEPAIQVIEIRPPGMSLPSGGSSGATGRSAPDDGGGAMAVANLVTAGTRHLDAPGRSSAELAPKAPAVDVTPVVLASASAGGADDEDEPSARRPGRGVVLREGGASGGSGFSGNGRFGRGFGGSTGGVTVIGPGGDCITPGSGTPVGLSIPNGPTPFSGNGGRATRGRTGGGYSGIRRPR
ncbi:MAG: hypothetical protein OEU54_00960 [Gemmatimonadota bacterium]|nr:hypothetical protein [Gemmatimonadota bacterium]